MRIDLFQMERTQCLYENEVEFNLSESGVLPLRVEEVLQSSKDSADFLSLGLKYPESDGSDELREYIAVWYGTDSATMCWSRTEGPRPTSPPCGDCWKKVITPP